MADNLDPIMPWLGALMARLSPAARRSLALRVGRMLHRTNAARVAANTLPDGSAMEPRKPRPPQRRADARTGRVRAKGKMFRRIAKGRNLRIAPTADDVSLSFTPAVRRTAAVHHFGLRDRVARFRGAPEADYASRPLLGFAPEDEGAIIEAALDHLSGSR